VGAGLILGSLSSPSTMHLSGERNSPTIRFTKVTNGLIDDSIDRNLDDTSITIVTHQPARIGQWAKQWFRGNAA
jgi:hypothetical protein